MARKDHKNADRSQHGSVRGGERQAKDQGDWYGGERGSEFGGEGRFRAQGGKGTHFGGEPPAPGAGHSDQPGSRRGNTAAWSDKLRRKFVETFLQWRSAAASGAGHPDADPAKSNRSSTGRKADPAKSKRSSTGRKAKS